MPTKFSIYVSYDFMHFEPHLNIALTKLDGHRMLQRTEFSTKLSTPEVRSPTTEHPMLVRGEVDKTELLAKLREFCDQIEQHWPAEEPT